MVKEHLPCFSLALGDSPATGGGCVTARSGAARTHWRRVKVGLQGLKLIEFGPYGGGARWGAHIWGSSVAGMIRTRHMTVAGSLPSTVMAGGSSKGQPAVQSGQTGAAWLP
jgi:hypothetical protein